MILLVSGPGLVLVFGSDDVDADEDGLVVRARVYLLLLLPLFRLMADSP